MIAVMKQEHITLLPVSDPMQGKSNEWYTPAKYVEAARKVMNGRIDLDPASCTLANQIVKADRYYTKEDNGLLLPWYGDVWCNPPFNYENGTGLKDWILKARSEYEDGNVEQATLLFPVPMRFCVWYHDLWLYPRCFPRKRILFYSGMHKENVANLFYCFLYMGTNEQSFIENFSRFGPIAKAIGPPRRDTEQPRLWTGVTS